jgi:hypothetical protein
MTPVRNGDGPGKKLLRSALPDLPEPGRAVSQVGFHGQEVALVVETLPVSERGFRVRTWQR